MGLLKDKLLENGSRTVVVQDCVVLVDKQVAAKKGVTGMMIKGGYKAFKAIKPTIVKEAVEILLDEFVVVLDHHYDAYLAEDAAQSTSFESWATSRDHKIADDMLGITDGMMERSNKKAIKKIYQGMRKVAEKNVAEAVPDMARLIVKHVG